MKTGMLVVAALAAAAPARADEEKPLTFITTDDLAARTSAATPARWSFTIVDARTRVEYEENHIVGAINCPASLAQTLLPRLVKDKDRELVFYCNGPKCTKSQKAARTAMALGYRRVLEYNEGMPAWGKAQLPVAGTPMPPAEMAGLSAEDLHARIEGGHGPAIVDVRDAVEFTAVHLAGAINIPLDELEKRVREVPRGEAVIMDHTGGQALITGRLLQKLGRTGLARLEGGLVAWQQKGYALEAKAVAAKQ